MTPETTDAAQILRQRAKALASTPGKPLEEATIEVLEFSLARERYAVETSWIREVHPLKELTPLPCTPAFIRGLVNIRGRVLPVLDLKKFFDLPENGLTDLHRIILVRGHGLELGLLADAIASVRKIPENSLQPPLPTLTGIGETYLKGITADCLVVLHLGRILADPKIVVHEEVEI